MSNAEITLLIQSVSDLRHLTATQLAQLLTALVQRELQPGGPYALSTHLAENIALNKKVFELFTAVGKDLPGAGACGAVIHAPVIPPVRTHKTHQFPLLTPSHRRLQKAALALTLPHHNHLIRQFIKKIQQTDEHGEITQLSTAFALSLKKPHSVLSPPATCAAYGDANFYTWLSYSLYDTALDSPVTTGRPVAIQHENNLAMCAANIYHRTAYHTYITAGASPTLLNLFFNDVDTANAEESSFCRALVINDYITIETLPNFSLLHRLLGQRSIAHCLGPALLSDAPPSVTKTIFLNYCAARQLSDDIHDWEDDIKNGRLTYVVTSLLRSAKILPGTYSLEQLLPRLRTKFWNTELAMLLKTVHQLAQEAEQSFIDTLHVHPDSSFIHMTSKRIIDATLHAQKDLQDTKEFLLAIQ